MYEEENMTPSEKALESALGQLKPITNILNRDQLMFKAGRMSAGSKGPWQILSGALTIFLFCSILLRTGSNEINIVPTNKEQNPIQVVHAQYQPAETDSYDSMAYPKLREKFLKEGWDALEFHKTSGNSESFKNQRELLNSMLSS
ncbi:MAG: hypothetical protein JXA96_05520 [Sedimentisphaerales bacterium]|nr:hypothetical protein [Sedimentisphaerales bacterium]